MGCWRNGVIKLKQSKKANEWVRWWFIDGTFVNAGLLVLCILPEPNIIYYLFIFCLEFPAAEISWLLLWRRISWFPVHLLLQQLDLSWLLVSPPPCRFLSPVSLWLSGLRVRENLVVWEFLWASSAGPNIFLLKHDGHAGSQETPQLCE